MFNIGVINWKNFVENLILGIAFFSMGSIVGYKASTMATDNAISQLKPVIERAIDKETIANTINNAIDLKIDKIKNSDSLQIYVNQTPTNNQQPTSTIIKKETPKPLERKGFVGRLFSKEKYK